MKVNIISVNQLRQNFALLKKAIERGESYILVYRSKPLAEIKPIQKKEEVGDNIEEKVQKVRQLAGGVRLGIKVSPRKLRQIFRTSYEKKDAILMLMF